jgi:hypothetical protein
MSSTEHRGLAKFPVTPAEVSGPWVNVVDTALDALDDMHGVEFHNAAGAITIKEGMVLVGGSGATALTLAAPRAGLPSAGGDDGKELVIVAVTAHAHTVNSTLATFAAIGDVARLVAYNGAWNAEASGASAPTPIQFFETGFVSAGDFHLTTANHIALCSFYVPQALTFSSLNLIVNNNPGGTHSSIGIYDRNTGALLAHTDATTAWSNGMANFPVVEGSVTLQPGWYDMAFTSDSNAPTIQQCGQGSYGFSDKTTNATTNGALPSSITITKGSTIAFNQVTENGVDQFTQGFHFVFA